MAPLLRLIAIVACVIVALGFAGFVSDEAGDASRTQVGKLDTGAHQPVPSSANETRRERRDSPVRERVDDANDILLSPFSGLTTDSQSAWARRVPPTLLALLAYGVGLTLLANALPRRRRRTNGDWRTAT